MPRGFAWPAVFGLGLTALLLREGGGVVPPDSCNARGLCLSSPGIQPLQRLATHGFSARQLVRVNVHILPEVARNGVTTVAQQPGLHHVGAQAVGYKLTLRRIWMN